MHRLRGRPGWRALVAGEATRRAEVAVEEIARCLASSETSDPSLAGGTAGQALFRAYLAGHRDSDADRELAVGLAEEALAVSVASGVGDVSLFSGLTGVAWVLAHLDGWILDLDEGDPCDAVDNALWDVLGEDTWPHDYDLISGLVGIGVYAFERLPRPTARACLEAVVAHLARLAHRLADGLTWPTAPQLLPEHQRSLAPDGYYNLGVAHGVPGVVALLADVRAASIATDTTTALLDGAVAWLLAQRLPPGSTSSLPNWVAPGVAPRPARSAWCYGDPGVAAVLHRAGLAVGNPAWTDDALAIARTATVRPSADTGVVDAAICHGAAGLAHIYNRFWQATGADEFAVAARHSIDRTLELLPEIGEDSFLEGRAGIGLVLLGALGVEPTWDRVLLLSHGQS